MMDIPNKNYEVIIALWCIFFKFFIILFKEKMLRHGSRNISGAHSRIMFKKVIPNY